MIRDCVFKRNIPSLIDSPEDKRFEYLKKHIADCEDCKQLYSQNNEMIKTLESWVPSINASEIVSKNLRDETKRISKDLTEVVHGRDLKKAFMKRCLNDFLWIFTKKSTLIILVCFFFFMFWVI